MGRKEQMQKVRELRESIARKIADLEAALIVERTRLATVDQTLALMSGSDLPASPSEKVDRETPQRNVKQTVLELVIAAANNGITAAEVVRLAAEQGRALKTASVSSLLSRLKAEGTLMFNGERYFPAQGDFERNIEKGSPGSPFRVPLTIAADKTAA